MDDPAGSGFDVLGDILSGSNIMNMNADSIIIRKDGEKCSQFGLCFFLCEHTLVYLEILPLLELVSV